MHQNLKLSLAAGLDRVGLLATFRRIHARRGGLVLTFHRILKAEDSLDCYEPNLVMSEGVFERLLSMLRSEFQIVPLQELLRVPSTSGHLQRVALTFDDGWADTYSVAFPLLQAYQVPATIFLCTGLIDRQQLLPEERFARIWNICDGRGHLPLLITDLRTWGGAGSPSAADRKEWARHLKRLPLETKLVMLAHLEHAYSVAPHHQRRFLTWLEARIMAQNGISFGSHTVRHATLNTEARDTVMKELVDSRNAIQKELGLQADYLAYPNGFFDSRVMQFTREAGYTHAFSTRKGLLRSQTDPYSIPRIAMDNSSVTGTSMLLNASRVRLHLQPFRLRPVPRFISLLATP